MSLRSSRPAPAAAASTRILSASCLELLVVDPAGPAGDLPRPRDREGPGGGGGVEVGVAGQQPHQADGGPGVLAAEAVPGGEPGGAVGVPVGVVAVVGVEPPQEAVGAAPSREVIAPSCSRASPRAGPSRSAAGGEFRYAPGARPTRSASATLANARPAGRAARRRTPAGGGQGASGPVWRAHHGPPPPAGFLRRLVCWAATADAPGVLLARAACLSYRLPVRSMLIK